MQVKNPDVWHYRDDAQKLLNLSVAQIRSILNDGGDSVSELTESFIKLAQTMNDLIGHKTDIDHTDLHSIKQQIEQGIIAFQFYDRISQRLEHVSTSLQSMSQLIEQDHQRHSKDAWVDVQKQIKDRFTMASEHQLFTDILDGVPLEEALKKASEASTEEPNSIELF
jgi:hypothetical protein